MKTPALVAALVLSFAGSAFADGATYDYPQAAASQASRASVMADLQAARADGSAAIGESWPALHAQSVRSRADVRAEAIAAKNDPAVRELHGESAAFDIAVVPAQPATVALAR